jgi:hypothetical protein
MGIYSDGKIYGVSLISSDVIVYSKKYPYIMGPLEINEVSDLYASLSVETKQLLKVSFWLKSSTTYEPTFPSEFMHWYPSDNQTLEELIKRTA